MQHWPNSLALHTHFSLYLPTSTRSRLRDLSLSKGWSGDATAIGHRMLVSRAGKIQRGFWMCLESERPTVPIKYSIFRSTSWWKHTHVAEAASSAPTLSLHELSIRHIEKRRALSLPCFAHLGLACKRTRLDELHLKLCAALDATGGDFIDGILRCKGPARAIDQCLDQAVLVTSEPVNKRFTMTSKDHDAERCQTCGRASAASRLP